MSVSDAIEKMVKLALRRHNEGIPKHIICFDQDGSELPWPEVVELSPKGKQGELETVMPTPGTGYFCDILLQESRYEPDKETHTFRVRSPTLDKTATYVQPSQGTAHITLGPTDIDEQTAAVLNKVSGKL
jgi:hypothetical protein